MHRDIAPVGVRLDSANGGKGHNAEVKEPDWFDIYTRIEHGDVQGEFLLRLLTSTGLSLILRRQSSRNLDQVVDACFIEAVDAIRSGKVRHAQEIASFLLKEGRRRLLEQPAASDYREGMVTIPRNSTTDRN